MTDELKLLGCPFCGGEARVGGFETESLWSHDIVPYLSIGCDGECDIAMQSEDHDGVRARWNARAPVAHLQHATLKHLVDLTWGRAFGSGEVPSTKIVNELIERAVLETGTADLSALEGKAP